MRNFSVGDEVFVWHPDEVDGPSTAIPGRSSGAVRAVVVDTIPFLFDNKEGVITVELAPPNGTEWRVFKNQVTFRQECPNCGGPHIFDSREGRRVCFQCETQPDAWL